VINPGAIPRFQGDVDALEADAGTLRGVGQDLRTTGAEVHSTWQGLAAFYEAPEAAQLFAATEPVRSRAGELGDDVASVAGTLSTYAAEVRPIAARLDALRAEAAAFVAEVANDDDWREDGDKVDRHNGLLTQVDQQVLALQDAERTAANAINALFGGRQWHAGGSDANAYGPTEIPADAERPWGAPEEKDEPWWKDVWNGGVSLVKGFFVDGLWDDVKGVFGFINVFDWDTFSASWGGLWTLTGKWFYAPGEAAEGWKNLGKALVAWDMWSQDPARAFGTVLFNVVTLPLAAAKVFKASKLGKADEVADAAGDAGKLPDGARLADELVDAGRLPDLPSVGDLAARLDASTPDLRTGDLDAAAGRADDLPTRAEEPARAGEAPDRADDVPAGDREPAPVGAREGADEGAATGSGGGGGGDPVGGGDPGPGPGRGESGDGGGARPDPENRGELDARRAVAERLGAEHPQLASVLEKLLDDTHPLNVTDALADPDLRPRTIELLEELAEGRALPDGMTLEEFRRAYPGEGPIFEVPDRSINFDADGNSRKQEFVDESKVLDPARAVDLTPTPEQRALVGDYADRLRRDVRPAVIAEIDELVDSLPGHLQEGVTTSARAKSGADLFDKVRRMVEGNENMPPRPDYQVGDVIDAVGARITVDNMQQLEAVLDKVLEHFGVGDGGRILELENMYAQPKARNPEYRVIPLTIAKEVDGQLYTFELQLTTRRASIAADLNHNTLYKPYVELTEAERAAVQRAMEEAAALDQLESRGARQP
jgi:ppGpp synthetase/RelA/SpoT-type nucleotidyltranferase